MGKRITQLDAAGPISGTEQIAIVQEGRTKRVPLDTVKTYTDTSCQCTLASRYDTSATAADLIEKYFQSYLMPANTLSVNGEFITINATIRFGATANIKNLYLRFGSSAGSVASFILSGSAVIYGDLYAKIKRTSANTQKFHARMIVGSNTVGVANSGVAIHYSTPTANLLEAVVISISGQNGTAAASDIIFEEMDITVHKLDPES